MVIHHARRRRRFGVDDVILAAAGIADGFRQMVVEHQVGAGDVRQVGRDVAGGDHDFAVLHVLGMDEQDVVDQFEMPEQHGAHETVEVAAGHEAEFVGNSGHLAHPFVVGCEWSRHGPAIGKEHLTLQCF